MVAFTVLCAFRAWYDAPAGGLVIFPSVSGMERNAFFAGMLTVVAFRVSVENIFLLADMAFSVFLLLPQAQHTGIKIDNRILFIYIIYIVLI